VYIAGEVGVGGNVIADGRPLVGSAGYAAEIGHIPVNPAGTECGCGSVGCWETEIGERAMLVRAGRSPDGGRAAVAELLADAERGDEAARAALDHVATWLGTGIASLVNVLNPRVVVLGGTFGRIHPLVGNTVRASMEARALRPPAELVRIVPGELGENAPILGAAELAFEELLADPATRLRPRAAALATA
jgi:predicted NBD/HSP70 family sugar kinase